MPSEFSSNIREIARELKETNAKTAASVRRAIRKSVSIAAIATTEAIKAAAAAEELHQAHDATNVKVSFSVRSGGAVIRTDQTKARYARPLEKGSKGSGGKFDRHPVFGSDGEGPLRQGFSRMAPMIGPLREGQKRRTMVWYNQPTRPYFYDSAKAMEPFSEAAMDAALGAALEEAGWTGVTRKTAQRAAARTQAVQAKARRARSVARRQAREAQARQREFHRRFGTAEQKKAVRAYDAKREAQRRARQAKQGR